MASILLPIIVNILIFIILLFTSFRNRLITYGLLFFLFMWAFVAFDLTLLQKVFYPLMLLFSISMTAFLNVKTNAEQIDLNGPKTKGGWLRGARFHLLTVAVGVVILFTMFYMQGGSQFTILGYPTLSISSTGGLTEFFSPTLSGALGFIENVAFVTLFELIILTFKSFAGLFNVIGEWLMGNPVLALIFMLPKLLLSLLSPAMPYILTGVGFGLFHINSYALELGAMAWAGMIFIMWLLSWKFLNKDTTAMDTAHYGWNAINTGRVTFQVAF